METPLCLPGMEAVVVGNPDEAAGVAAADAAAPRLRRPDRRQALLQPCVLDELLPADHPARTIWAVVERLDLSLFEAAIAARGGEPGRAATDPRLLVALWLYAYTRGVGSGRELDRLCSCRDDYRWLCGGVAVNYHTLCDFRVAHAGALDGLFTQVVTRLVHKGLVDIERLSQDGTKVRASAGASSFRREETLVELQARARAHLSALREQADKGEPAQSPRRVAARERAARERLERIEAALAEAPELAAAKARYGNAKRKARVKTEAVRASTSDAEARKMKMADGGYRPAYNVQLAAAPQSRAIVAVSVSNHGSDQHQSVPLREQARERTGQDVKQHLLDGGYVHLDSIEAAGAQGVAIYAPLPAPRAGIDPTRPKKGDGPHTAAWRQRMGTAEAKAIYKQPAATSETVNADLKTWRGLSRLTVRGIKKATCVALWSALAYNLLHFGTTLAA